jgi:hypothetical protein
MGIGFFAVAFGSFGKKGRGGPMSEGLYPPRADAHVKSRPENGTASKRDFVAIGSFGRDPKMGAVRINEAEPSGLYGSGGFLL